MTLTETAMVSIYILCQYISEGYQSLAYLDNTQEPNPGCGGLTNNIRVCVITNLKRCIVVFHFSTSEFELKRHKRYGICKKQLY